MEGLCFVFTCFHPQRFNINGKRLNESIEFLFEKAQAVNKFNMKWLYYFSFYIYVRILFKRIFINILHKGNLCLLDKLYVW